MDRGNTQSDLTEKLVTFDGSGSSEKPAKKAAAAAPDSLTFTGPYLFSLPSIFHLYSMCYFTEFLRVNMRLAEDRILSFVCVFSTGYGTKWIPGATFFYQPEIRWQTLLTQRRRWLNGTFASFLFFFNSKRAKSRISGGMFDSHKAGESMGSNVWLMVLDLCSSLIYFSLTGKNIRFVNALWSLQLMQLLLVLVAPAVFGSSSYIGIHDSARIWPGSMRLLDL